jgi:hypothetical protein
VVKYYTPRALPSKPNIDGAVQQDDLLVKTITLREGIEIVHIGHYATWTGQSFPTGAETQDLENQGPVFQMIFYEEAGGLYDRARFAFSSVPQK